MSEYVHSGRDNKQIFLEFYNLIDEIFETTFHGESCKCKHHFFIIYGKLLYEEGNYDLVGIFRQGRYVNSTNDFYMLLKNFSYLCLPMSIHVYNIKKQFCYHCGSSIFNNNIRCTEGLSLRNSGRRAELIKAAHDFMRKRWITCVCIFSGHMDILRPLREWRRGFPCVYISIEYDYIRSQMPEMMMVVNKYTSMYSSTRSCSCYPSYWKILTGVLIEMHNDTPQNDINTSLFLQEANVAFNMLRNMHLVGPVDDHYVGSIMQITNYCPYFCYVLAKHPHAEILNCLLEINRNMNFNWERCPRQCRVNRPIGA